MQQIPDDLKKILDGNRVTVLNGEKPLAAPIGRRACGNCYHNPANQFCHLEPVKFQMLMTNVQVPSSVLGGKPTTEVRPQPVPVPSFIMDPTYVCSHHVYEREVPPNRRRDALEINLPEAQNE